MLKERALRAFLIRKKKKKKKKDAVRALTGSGRASSEFPAVEGILSRVEGIWRNVKSKDNGENCDYILTAAKKLKEKLTNILATRIKATLEKPHSPQPTVRSPGRPLTVIS
jgi:C4-type Zn-finger protein